MSDYIEVEPGSIILDVKGHHSIVISRYSDFILCYQWIKEEGEFYKLTPERWDEFKFKWLPDKQDKRTKETLLENAMSEIVFRHELPSGVEEDFVISKIGELKRNLYEG
ncbi:MAG: hypothetical protein GTN38_02245 [Candidatus Aenigmarchaeota archaeon]|nr:hypothetical protein [Candidatus Aenigmarchaeota archaeon]NIP40374.1 hypothetical protein [Candidatus Aenigmarchaeota archaeon]NIQ18300.1 hypothetical protein [Candidatus Aenigmarchaeota archaeon]NIS73252.1 hypothetical protein [Candidatus Aenigmarchaeota archaeon]